MASKASEQTATERRAAEAELRALIRRFAPEHVRLVGAMRRRLRARLPTAHEVVYEYGDCCVISVSPSEHGYEGVFVIRAGAGGVRLYFNSGKGLPDPEKLLEGSGKRARWMAVEGASTLSRPAEARLVEEAVARSPVAFARSGGGTVLVRSTTAKRAREGGSAARGAGPRKKSG